MDTGNLSAAMHRAKTRLVWLDLEMSGLDPNRDVILEVASIVTDGDLQVVAESETWAVRQDDSVLEQMDSWNTRIHGHSGLTVRCRDSQLDTRQVEKRFIKFLKKNAVGGASPMCGNSICQDRRFLAREMPQAEKFFHYRNFDVSCFKIAARLFNPKVFMAAKNDKESSHQALQDIRESIAEMRLYLDKMLITPTAEACNDQRES